MPVHPGLGSPFTPTTSNLFATQASSQPTPPMTGGYPSYSHAPQTPSWQQDYSIHQQFYRPTEAESGLTPQQFQPKQEPRGKLEENARRLERGVTGMLKKFEKFG